MSLSAKYGMGKTTFIDCWRQELKNKNIKTVKFNAWETDFSNDAFSSFISAFQAEFKEDKKASDTLVKMSKEFGLALLKSTPKLLIELVFKKITDKNFDDFLEDIETDDDEVSKLFSNAVAASFDAHQKTVNAIDEFKVEFETFVLEECNGKLIVFIDELDRCRPAYSVEVLERIKHLFSVKGVIFILGVDRTQLLNSISGVYGNNLDSEGYIRKFIDWDFELKAPRYEVYIPFLFSEIFDMDDKFSEAAYQNTHHGIQNFLEHISFMAKSENLSLRELEQYFTNLNLITQHHSLNGLGFVPISIQLYLKIFHPSAYEESITSLSNNYFKTGAINDFISSVFSNEKNSDDSYNHSSLKTTTDLIVFLSECSHDPNNAKLCIGESLHEEINEILSKRTSEPDLVKKLIIPTNERSILYNLNTRRQIAGFLNELPNV